MQPLTVIFLGPQGCGKGTQLKLVADFLQKKEPARGVLAPAMGNLLRSMAERDTYAASLLRPVLERGDLVEYAVSVSLFGNYLLENLKEGQHLLIDGFPRHIEQVTLLESVVRYYQRSKVVVVRLEISEEESLRRLAERHRSDDTPEAIRTRLAWTRRAEKEIEGLLRSNPAYTFIEIQGERPIEVVHQDILKVLTLS